MNLTIAIDDVNPKKGWRILGDKTENYLFSLNKDYGVKFTLFIPSNHHNEAPISENKNWLNELKDSGIFELAAHGHYHQTTIPEQIGECEFFELQTPQQVNERLKLLTHEWGECFVQPVGWRNPGWLASDASIQQLSNYFNYSAVHYEHNRNRRWGCEMIFGHDGIDQTNIQLHDNTIMFQSHIFGDWNDNVWNNRNYEQVRLSIDYLVSNNEVQFKTIEEVVDSRTFEKI